MSQALAMQGRRIVVKKFRPADDPAVRAVIIDGLLRRIDKAHARKLINGHTVNALRRQIQKLR